MLAGFKSPCTKLAYKIDPEYIFREDTNLVERLKGGQDISGKLDSCPEGQTLIVVLKDHLRDL